MANTISTFTGLVHPKATAIQLMDNLGIRACVQIYLPEGTTEQKQQLGDFLRGKILCRIPLRSGSRQFIYCRYEEVFSDECLLNTYTAILHAVLGNNTRAHVRIYRKGGKL